MLGPYFMSYKYNSSTCLILHLEFTDKSFKINMNWKNYTWLSGFRFCCLQVMWWCIASIVCEMWRINTSPLAAQAQWAFYTCPGYIVTALMRAFLNIWLVLYDISNVTLNRNLEWQKYRGKFYQIKVIATIIIINMDGNNLFASISLSLKHWGHDIKTELMVSSGRRQM